MVIKLVQESIVLRSHHWRDSCVFDLSIQQFLQSYCRHADVRPPYNPFSQKPLSELTQNLGEATCPAYLQTSFCLFFKMLKFLRFLLFILVNMGPYGRNMRGNLLRKHTTDSIPKIYAYSQGLQQRCSKNCEISIFGFWHLFYVSLTWDNMGEHLSNDISCSHHIHSSQFRYILGRDSTNIVKGIAKLETFNVLLFLGVGWVGVGVFFGQLTWQSVGNCTMCCIFYLKAGPRANGPKFGPRWVNTLVYAGSF